MPWLADAFAVRAVRAFLFSCCGRLSWKIAPECISAPSYSAGVRYSLATYACWPLYWMMAQKSS